LPLIARGFLHDKKQNEVVELSDYEVSQLSRQAAAYAFVR